MGGKASDPNKAAMRAQKDQMKRLDNLSVPELEEYMLQSPELVGLLDAENIDPSKMEDISTDPRLKADMMGALEGLRERSQQGLTEQDKFAMEEMMGKVGAQEKSQRAVIEQEMQQRGTADSGTALAAKLQGSTSANNNARQQAMQMAAQGQQQRMGALQNLGQMSGQMQAQDFSQKAQTASAQDIIARANAMNRQGVAGQNLASRQGIENQRAEIANQQAQVGNQIKQQNFGNQMSKATGQGSVAANMSNIAANAPQKPGGLQAGLAGAASGAATGASLGGPAGAAWGAGIGAGAGILSSLEDGGIARSKQDEDKAHDKFKKEYMKRVREELAPQRQAVKEVTGGVPRFQDSGIVQQEEYKPYDFAGKSLNDNLKAGNATTLGQNNDATSVNTYEEAKELMPDKSGFNLDGDKLAKGLGALSSLVGGDQPAQQKALNLSYQGPQVQNTMTPMVSKFDNPMSRYQNPQFADGGISKTEALSSMLSKLNPAYACGGLHKGTMKAEDGSVMFDSTGESSIVGGDSFEDDRVDARLNSGEAVLNVAQQQRLMDVLKGEADLTDLGDDDIVEGVPRDYQESLKDKLDSGKDFKMEGLKKLLKALGEG